MSLYDVFHLAYGWTMAEIDNTELDYILTLRKVKLLQDKPQDELHYIDEVL